MKKLDIVIVRAEDVDWEGLYVNGELYRQRHFIEADDIISALVKHDLITYESKELPLPEDGEGYPKNLE